MMDASIFDELYEDDMLIIAASLRTKNAQSAEQNGFMTKRDCFDPRAERVKGTDGSAGIELGTLSL